MKIFLCLNLKKLLNQLIKFRKVIFIMKLKFFALLAAMTTILFSTFTCFASNNNPLAGSEPANPHESISTIGSGEKAQYGIVNAVVGISYNPSKNNISFNFITRATHVSSQIGMGYFALEKWNANAQRWDAVLAGPEYATNLINHSASYTYNNVTRNAYYRVTGTHYAKINGTGYSMYNETNYIYTN